MAQYIKGATSQKHSETIAVMNMKGTQPYISVVVEKQFILR